MYYDIITIEIDNEWMKEIHMLTCNENAFQICYNGVELFFYCINNEKIVGFTGNRYLDLRISGVQSFGSSKWTIFTSKEYLKNDMIIFIQDFIDQIDNYTEEDTTDVNKEEYEYMIDNYDEELDI